MIEISRHQQQPQSGERSLAHCGQPWVRFVANEIAAERRNAIRQKCNRPNRRKRQTEVCRTFATHVLTRDMKYNPPQAKITIGVHTAGAGGSNACSPSC